MLVLSLKHARPSRPHVTAALAITASLAIALIGPWLMRNAILTGYPLYPLPLMPLPFDWTIPAGTVRAYRDVLSDFARIHGSNFVGASTSLAWVGPWLARSWRDVAAPVVIGLVAPLALFVTAPRLARGLGIKWLSLLPLWIGVLAWFISSPDPRYAKALLWLTGAVPLAFCMAATPHPGRVLLALVFVAAVEMPNASYLLRLVQISSAIVSGQFAGEPELPDVPLSVSVMNSGLHVYGPSGQSDQVWDAPLPASAWRPDPT